MSDKRDNILKDDEEQGIMVTAPLRDQIVDKLVKKLEEKEAGHELTDLWNTHNSYRARWLERQAEYLTQVDEFIDDIYATSSDWNSNLHLPTTLTVCKTFHARFLSAIFSQDPPFNVRARQEAHVDRAPLIQDLLRYTIKDWANHYEGVEAEVDAWLWSWVTAGSAILKARWDKQFARFVDVEMEEQSRGSAFIPDPESGELIEIPQTEIVEVEREKVITAFDGPCLENVKIEDVVIIGGEGNPQKADHVIQQCYLTEGELWTLADQGVFKEDAVKEVIESGANSQITADATGNIKTRRAYTAGDVTTQKRTELDRFRVLECHTKMDVDGSGIPSDLIVFVHPDTGRILRASYAYRVYPHASSGCVRPFFKIDFHKRLGQEYGVGLVELCYSLSKELDAMRNMRVDFGVLSTMPFGFVRATSSMDTTKLPLEPGVLIPVDNPADIYFPNLGNRVSFGLQEEAALQQQIERLVSLSDINHGIISGQGATRTATGTRAILGESNANLDVFLKRLNRGWKQAIKFTFSLLQSKMPAGMQFRVLGDDGQAYWQTVKSRQEIAGAFDVEIDSNSSNSNPQVRTETANLVFQMAQNPLLLQLGLITPLGMYEAAKALLQAQGVKDVSRYLTKPQGLVRVYTPEEIANRLLAGMDVPLDPTQDLEGFINYVQYIGSTDEILGQFDQQQWAALQAKAVEAQNLLQAVAQAAAQQRNIAQQMVNSQSSPMAQGPGMTPAAGGGEQ